MTNQSNIPENVFKGGGAATTPLLPGDLLYVPTHHQGSSFNPMSLLSFLPFVNYLHL